MQHLVGHLDAPAAGTTKLTYEGVELGAADRPCGDGDHAVGRGGEQRGLPGDDPHVLCGEGDEGCNETCGGSDEDASVPAETS